MRMHSRRAFLARTLGAAWVQSTFLERAQLRAAQARAQSKQAPPRIQLFDLEKAADGVYAAIARPRAIINSNAVIFENARDLLIVDAHSTPSAASALVAQIRREIGPKPVRYIVATHMHGDHTQGLPAYRRMTPAPQIISSEKTRQLASELNPGRLKSALEAVPRNLENYRKRLEEAKSLEEKTYYTEMISQTRDFLAEMKDCPIELPDVTFAQDLIIHDKAHDIHLSFRGRAHTAGDIIAFCPQKRVIASGDLAHGFLPNIGDGYPRDWPATIDSVSRLEFDYVMGGHGGVQRNRDRIAELRAYMQELLEVTLRGREQGRPLDEIQRAATPDSFKSLTGGYGDYLSHEIKRHDFRVTLSTPEEVLTRGVRDNVAAAYRGLDKV